MMSEMLSFVCAAKLPLRRFESVNASYRATIAQPDTQRASVRLTQTMLVILGKRRPLAELGYSALDP